MVKLLTVSIKVDTEELKKIEAIQAELSLKSKSQVLRTGLKDLHKKICKNIYDV